MTTNYLPPVFSEAMHRHIDLAEQFGEENPQATQSFMAAMLLAPQWFKKEVQQ